MAEETQVIETPQEQAQEQPAPSPFSSAAWSEDLPEVKPAGEAAVATTTTETVAATTETTVTQPAASEDEILDPKVWLKREFDVDDVAILKAEREELKKLKETGATPSEIKFANEQSKLVHELIREGKTKEVRQYLETQERIESVVSAEVNKDNAADIIKLGMQLKYKDLTPDEINYKYEKQYGLPKEPKQAVDELDEDFEARKAEWQEKVSDIQVNKVIEAKLIKPEIQSAAAKLVLPELTQKQPEGPSQESLAAQTEAMKKVRENFLNKLESEYSKVEGFTTKVKDESVELPITFKIPDEEKVAIKERFKAGIDLNDFIDKRWSDEAGNPKIDQIISDIYSLENLDKVLSGVANNAANQRLAEHIKANKNVNINGKTPQQTFEQTGGNQKISPFSKDAWSETPPSLVNN